MNVTPLTASEVMRFCQALEQQAAQCYRALAETHAALADELTAWANECDKAAVQVARSYQETVSDALETGYAFPDLRLAEYACDWPTSDGSATTAVLTKCRDCEKLAAHFYGQAASAAESLLATIPATLRRIGRVHSRSATAIQQLLEELT